MNKKIHFCVKYKILIIVLLSQTFFAQTLSRKNIIGTLVNDAMKLENGIIFNKTGKSGTTVDANGNFHILAKVSDTLIISSIGFKTTKIILTKKDIDLPVIRIPLEMLSSELDDIFVKKSGKTNAIQGNIQDIIDTQREGDFDSSPKNLAMPPDQTTQGVDFVRITKSVFNWLKTNNPEKTDFISQTPFATVVIHSLEYRFFTETLKLKEDEVGLFLIYCENDPISKKLLEPEKEFERLNFLIEKNIEFKKITEKK